MSAWFNIDGFIALVAAALAGFCFWAAATNQDWFYRLKKAKWLAEKHGRGTARIAYFSLGLLLIAIAALIWFGFRIDWSGS